MTGSSTIPPHQLLLYVPDTQEKTHTPKATSLLPLHIPRDLPHRLDTLLAGYVPREQHAKVIQSTVLEPIIQVGDLPGGGPKPLQPTIPRMVRELHRVKGSDIQAHQLENEGGHRITDVSENVIVSLLLIAAAMVVIIIMTFVN